MCKALYRKYNDRTRASSTYHKKDGTNVRAKLKCVLRRSVTQIETKNPENGF